MNDEKELYVNADDITEFSTFIDIPNGSYTAKLTKVSGEMTKGSETKAPTPQVVAYFDIQDGEFVGESLRVKYNLYVSTGTTQKGKPWTFAPGIAEMKSAFQVIGKPVPPGFNFLYGSERNAQIVAAKVFGPRFANLVVEIERFDEVQMSGKGGDRKPVLDQDGNPKTFKRNRIVGLAAAQVADDLLDIA